MWLLRCSTRSYLLDLSDEFLSNHSRHLSWRRNCFPVYLETLPLARTFTSLPRIWALILLRPRAQRTGDPSPMTLLLTLMTTSFGAFRRSIVTR